MTEKNELNQAGWNFNNSYANLPELFFTKMDLNPVSAPELVVFNNKLASSLGLNADALQNQAGTAIFAGNKAPEGAMPLAQAYAGHQFGGFTMLGDGRALLLGEQIAPSGERFDVQLKGSGRTPYSRGGDGRAALGPMLREYIISEAMNALAIPTTRSLAVVTTGEPVYRETELTGAILTRIASSHLRVGTFQYAANWGTQQDVQALADYAIKRHYPNVTKEEDRYLAFLREVIKRQAALITQWQLVGFIHGVMNTDNMAISGETIDYGPCAFMNSYDPATVFSSIDRQGRYAYGNQPYIASWNLARFAEALLPLLDEDQEKAIKKAEAEIAEFSKYYRKHWFDGMRAKLGLFHEGSEDEELIQQLLTLMQNHQADYTNTFLALTFEQTEGTPLLDTNEFREWHRRWQARLNGQQESAESVLELMKSHNPAVIPRNHRVEEALEAAVEHEDYSVMDKLLEVLEKPYDHSQERSLYCSPPEPSNVPYRTYCGT